MRKILSILLSLIFVLSLVGCSPVSSEGDAKVFYVNTDKDGLTSVDYKYEAVDAQGQVVEVLNKLAADTDSVDYMSTIPSGVSVKTWELDDKVLTLNLVGDYEELDVYTEILVRAAMVKSLTQIDGVDSVVFFVNGKPHIDINGEVVGAMTADAFIDDFGQETESLLSTELTLYFSSADGVSLVPEKRQVYYSRNVSIDKLIIEQLLKGPDSNNLLASVPASTKVNSISISENGVCIVNFDASFETPIVGVTEKVTVYSIVNSLAQLDSIKQVQILVNGETPHLSNLDVDLSNAISPNEDIINTSIVTDEDERLDTEIYEVEEEFIDETEYIEEDN